VQLPKSVKISEHVADLRAFIDTALEGRRPVVVAHSFGGVLSMQVHTPTSVLGVTLTCAAVCVLLHSAHENISSI
jgi:pimeloyl-ACP methyl ester carboxylesterase